MRALSFAVATAASVSLSFFAGPAAASSVVSRATSFTPINGAADANGVVERMPFDMLRTQQPDVFNMYLLGVKAMQEADESDLLSWYQVCGIHGRPYIPWEEPTSNDQDPSRGYCTHASVLFGTWHRPYLVLIEQLLVQRAQEEAAKFTGEAGARYQAAAKNVRLPYWDWASMDTQSHIPDFVMNPTCTVTVPDDNGNAVSSIIQNPLYQYTFTNKNYLSQYFDGFWATVDSTRRQPDSNGNSQDAVADEQMSNSFDARKQNTYNLFSIPSFSDFSSTQFHMDGTPNSWTSVESIHNDIHVLLGGDLGHMTQLAYSGFDPIFWLHHTNVDRLIAMYQAIYPGEIIEPHPASGTFARKVSGSDTDDVNTPLHPFRHPNGQLFTSVDVSSASSIWTYNYAYPDVPASFQSQSDSDLKDFTTQRVNLLYGPNAVPGSDGFNDSATNATSSGASSADAGASQTFVPAVSSSSSLPEAVSTFNTDPSVTETGESDTPEATGEADGQVVETTTTVDAGPSSTSVSSPGRSRRGRHHRARSDNNGLNFGSIRDSANIQVKNIDIKAGGSLSAAVGGNSTNVQIGLNDTVSASWSYQPASRREFLVHVLFNQAEVDGSCEILVFLGNHTSDVTKLRSEKNFIGSVASFADKGITPMKHNVTGTVPITKAMLDASVSLEPDQAVPHLKSQLQWVACQGNKVIPLENIPSLVVGVSSSVVDYSGSINVLPKWGNFETHYGVTAGKEGGLSYTGALVSLVKSTPDLSYGGTISFNLGGSSGSYESSDSTGSGGDDGPSGSIESSNCTCSTWTTVVTVIAGTAKPTLPVSYNSTAYATQPASTDNIQQYGAESSISGRPNYPSTSTSCTEAKASPTDGYGTEKSAYSNY